MKLILAIWVVQLSSICVADFKKDIETADILIHSDVDSATKLIQEMQGRPQLKERIDLMWEIQLLQLKLAFARGEFSKSMALGEDLLAQCQYSQDNEFKLKVLLALSNSYNYTVYKPRLLELNQKAYDLACYLGDTTAIISSLNAFGDVYKNSEEHDKCFEYYSKANMLAKIHGNKERLANSNKYLGTYYLTKKNVDSSFLYLKQAEGFYRTSHYKDEACLVWIRIGRTHARNSSLDSAVWYYDKANRMAHTINSPLWAGRSYFHWSLVEAERGDNIYALKLLDSAQYNLRKAEDLLVLRGVFRKKSAIYKQQNKTDSAFFYFRRHVRLRDSIQKRQNHEQIMNIKWDQQLDKKQKSVTFYKEKSEILNDKNKAEKRSRLWLILALGAMTFLTLVWFQLYKQRHKSLVQEKELRELDKRQAEQELRHQQQMKEMADKQHQLELELKNRELTTLTMEISQKSQDISGIHERIKGIEETIQPDTKLGFNMLKELRGISKELKFESGKEKEWQQFKLHFEQVHTDFFKILKEKHPILTAYDLKLCAYFHMNLGIKQVSNILNISYDAVKKQRTRMRKKMELDQDTNLLNYLNSISESSKRA